MTPAGEVAATVPYRGNSGVIFMPGSDTWHGFRKRAIDGVRRSLIVNYVKPEWRARHELLLPGSAGGLSHMDSSSSRPLRRSARPALHQLPDRAAFQARAWARAISAAWLAALDPAAALSLYLHVPFCSALCWYCGCHTKVPGHDEPVARYVDGAGAAKSAGVADLLAGRQRVVHLHWGGGTPTIIGPDRFRRVMRSMRRRFAVAGEAELAIEIDPRRLTPRWRRPSRRKASPAPASASRSFDPVVQQAINRVQSFAATERAVDLLRGAGIAGINFDLIYGLPHQTVALLPRHGRRAPRRSRPTGSPSSATPTCRR